MWKNGAVRYLARGLLGCSRPNFFILFLHFKICGQMWNSVRYRAGGLLGCLRPKRRGSRSVESAPLLPPALLQPRASWEISQSQILTNFPIWTSFVAFYLDFYVISTFWILGTWYTVESVNFILQLMIAIELEVVPGWPIENAEWENLWLCYNMQTRTGWSGGKPGQLEIWPILRKGPRTKANCWYCFEICLAACSDA